MRRFSRVIATLLAATLLMTGLVLAPVAAEETEVSEPVSTQELVEMEGSLAPVNAEGTSAEEVSRFARITSDNGDGTSGGIRLDGETIEENSYQVREIRSITDLINALGGNKKCEADF